PGSASDSVSPRRLRRRLRPGRPLPRTPRRARAEQVGARHPPLKGLPRPDSSVRLRRDEATTGGGAGSRRFRPSEGAVATYVRIRPKSGRHRRYIYAVAGFGAVVTTGIYCRPGCSARPNRENLRSYVLAAAAEAGRFRACSRCRPYRESGLAPWTAPELVCRAVRLILDGALDAENEETLGSRLGGPGRPPRRACHGSLAGRH